MGRIIYSMWDYRERYAKAGRNLWNVVTGAMEIFMVVMDWYGKK